MTTNPLPPAFSSFPDLEEPTQKSPHDSEEGHRSNRSHKSKKAAHSPRRESRRVHSPGRKKSKHSERDRGKGDWIESSQRRAHQQDQPDIFAKDKHARRKRPHTEVPSDDEETRFNPRFDLEDEIKRPEFLEDSKGDPDNLRFGAARGNHIPKTGRGEYRSILGMPHGWTAHRAREMEIRPTRRQESTRYTTSKWIKRLTSTQSRKLLPDAPNLLVGTTDFQSNTGFIALPTSRRHREDQLAEYRSITTLSRPRGDDSHNSSSASDSDGANDSDNEFTSPSTALSQANITLNRHVQLNPSDITGWLALLAHSVVEAPTSDARANIGISILEKAFRAHKDNHSNPILRAKYLSLGESVWPRSQLVEQWDRALSQLDAGSAGEKFHLWMDYLTWRVRAGGIGELEEAVNRIRSLARRVPKSHAQGHFELRMLWRSCVALFEAGYRERALATFQAQIELTTSLPSQLKEASFEAKLGALETFWDSGAPRIGEKQAVGWSTSAVWNSETTPTSPPLVAAQLTSTHMEDDTYVRWAEAEAAADHAGRMPFRAPDSSDEDPYATILFSDIRPFLFDPSQLPDLTIVVYASLQFIGLHFPGLTAFLDGRTTGMGLTASSLSVCDSAWADNMFMQSRSQRDTLLGPKAPTRSWEVVNGVVVGQERKVGGGWGAVKEWTWNTRRPLEGHDERGGGRQWEKQDIQTLDVDLIRRIFEQCSPRLQSESFDQNWIAFEASIGIKTALKISKTFLSQHSSSPSRWSLHARLERIRGKAADARKIYETAAASSSLGQSRDLTRLYWEWAEMEWLMGRHEQANVVLIKAAAIQGDISASTILRAKRFLDSRIQEVRRKVGEGDVRAADAIVPTVNLSALLELLSLAHVPTALAKFDIHFEPSHHLSSAVASQIHESLALASAQLLFHHAKTLKSPIPPSVLQTHLSTLVQRFPCNTILLGMWLESERGESVWGRVRKLVRQAVLVPTSDGTAPSACLWSVWQETRDNMNWEVARVRSTLSQALEGDRSRLSPTLWRVSVELEIAMGRLNEAKSMLYRALSACPWVKDLYLLAFAHPLRPMFTARELDQLTDSMAERQIRVRITLEDTLQSTANRNIGKAEEASDDGDHEIEIEAQERRRLMPF